MKAIRLILLALYACAVLSAGYWTVTAMDRLAHAVATYQERTEK